MPGTTEPKRIGLIKKKTIRLVLKLYQDLLELVLTYYLRFGRKVVRIEVGSHTMVCHTIPENLLCQSSALFRDELQPKRKDVSGDCSICNEVLQPNVEELTFCSESCCQNFHYDCIEKWKNQTENKMQYPHCRSEWAEEKNTIAVH
jgi:hypothetical protein